MINEIDLMNFYNLAHCDESQTPEAREFACQVLSQLSTLCKTRSSISDIKADLIKTLARRYRATREENADLKTRVESLTATVAVLGNEAESLKIEVSRVNCYREDLRQKYDQQREVITALQARVASLENQEGEQ